MHCACNKTLSYILNPIACLQRQCFLKIGVTVVKMALKVKAQMTISESTKVFRRTADMIYINATVVENLSAEATGW